MRHTFVVSGGVRVEIQPSKTEPGSVLLSIAGAFAAISASTAALIAQALEIEAAAAESMAQSVTLAKGLAASVSGAGCCTTPRPDCMGMLVPSIGDNCKALKDDACDCIASRHVGRFKPPCTCSEGRLSYFRSGGPVMSELPVVDVPQVERVYFNSQQLRTGV